MHPTIQPLTAPRQTGPAAIFTVNTTVDSPLASSSGTTCVDAETLPNCSLRAAIGAANNLKRPVEIVLGAATYTLTDTAGGLLAVTNPGGTEIVGISQATTVIATPTGGTLTVLAVRAVGSTGGMLFASNLTITGGNDGLGGGLSITPSNSAAVLTSVTVSGNLADANQGDQGGGIYDAGSLWMTNSSVTNNSGGYGGGMTVVGGYASLNGVAISQNAAVNGAGGGIYAVNSTVSMNGGSITSNTSMLQSGGGQGGGLYAANGTVVLSNVVVSSNQALAKGYGGGMYIDGNANLVISGGQVSHNAVTGNGSGGGMFLSGQAAMLTKVTVTYNSVGVNGLGGGILANSLNTPTAGDLASSLVISGGTISNNINGGIFGGGTVGSALQLSVTGTVISSNTSDSNYACGPAVCLNAAAADSAIEAQLTKDVMQHNVATLGIDAAGAVQVGASTTGTATLELASDTISLNTSNSTGGCGGICVDLAAGSAVTFGVSKSSIVSNTAPDGNGGGIQVTSPVGGTPGASAAMTLTGDVISSNTSGSTAKPGIGGGLFIQGNVNGSVSGTTFANDIAAAGSTLGGNGGAVYDSGNGTISYSADTFTGDSSPGIDSSGGALVLTSAGATVSNSSFTGDSTGAWGGGVYVSSNAAITGSTFATDTAGSSAVGGMAGEGGAIYVGGGAVSITNSTLTGDSAFDNGSTLGRAGGVYQEAGTVSFDYSTIDANVASLGAGYFEAGNLALGGVLRGTILTDNTTGTGTEADCMFALAAGVPTSVGSNVLGQAACVAVETFGDETSTAPLLVALAANGGPTKTMALATGSPAIALGLSCPPTDQRGDVRPLTGCDAGAYELTP